MVKYYARPDLCLQNTKSQQNYCWLALVYGRVLRYFKSVFVAKNVSIVAEIDSILLFVASCQRVFVAVCQVIVACCDQNHVNCCEFRPNFYLFCVARYLSTTQIVDSFDHIWTVWKQNDWNGNQVLFTSCFMVLRLMRIFWLFLYAQNQVEVGPGKVICNLKNAT